MLLLTGAAGFIGFHMARRLLAAGHDIVGVDDLNSYYDPALKQARLDQLASSSKFRFVACDIAAPGMLEAALPARAATLILHLAAQAGVRYSLEAPFAYEHANLAGHLAVLEYAKSAPALSHLVYASSSSVYGDRHDGPFREDDRCDTPASLYGATKRGCELMSEAYARLHGLRQTGLRFFTVYGPWGRPDMAYWSFTDAILAARPIPLFGEGKLARDFTYIDDMAPAIERLLEKPPAETPPHRILNLGNSHPSTVLDLVAAIERATGVEAIREPKPPQKGDVTNTFADISRAKALVGFEPSTSLEMGIARFVEWRKAHASF
ncbi:MAG TPA: NAD-dependent epimerase/dehydratase family protein [Caulobacterales bacterium]|nr:NAD-dependent epimerase/dehydratase family protein [Caulobacterales bacterium]